MLYIAGGKERCVILANYMIENKATVRAVASKFGISKSTVHKDLTEVLLSVNKSLYIQVKEILERNKSERHIRGGEATKKKYKSNNKS
jgi:putative DeoR family transcriptional regulator (stage III sporulation protein D)